MKWILFFGLVLALGGCDAKIQEGDTYFSKVNFVDYHTTVRVGEMGDLRKWEIAEGVPPLVLSDVVRAAKQYLETKFSVLPFSVSGVDIVYEDPAHYYYVVRFNRKVSIDFAQVVVWGDGRVLKFDDEI